MTPKHIILASNSPRRRELLEQVGIQFTADPADVDESRLPDEPPEVYATRLALEKAQATASRHKDGLVLGADTVVAVNGFILGKPASTFDAEDMLAKLSGVTHRVVTGVAIVDASTGRAETACATTSVRIKRLSPEAIKAYVATGEPMDKAGGYGIQGRAAVFVTGIDGCYSNVVGLPLSVVADMLETFGWRV